MRFRARCAFYHDAAHPPAPAPPPQTPAPLFQAPLAARDSAATSGDVSRGRSNRATWRSQPYRPRSVGLSTGAAEPATDLKASSRSTKASVTRAGVSLHPPHIPPDLAGRDPPQRAHAGEGQRDRAAYQRPVAPATDERPHGP
jgi:hypothetical protein